MESEVIKFPTAGSSVNLPYNPINCPMGGGGGGGGSEAYYCIDRRINFNMGNRGYFLSIFSFSGFLSWCLHKLKEGS